MTRQVQLPFNALAQPYCLKDRMEEWGFVDDRDLGSFKGHRSCATCHHFGYVTLGNARYWGHVT